MRTGDRFTVIAGEENGEFCVILLTDPVTSTTGICMYVCMYGIAMFARSNSKITVTSVLMKHMLC